uniref:Amyloid protein-binding protein 2 n=1 Tax=Castor canadensis TaxID=51338 RepID=A0A8C0X6A6_CASCN
MAAVELEWIPETLYNTAISAVVDNYIRSRRDIRSLPENIQFDVYYKLYQQGRLCQLGSEFCELEVFAKVLRALDKSSIASLSICSRNFTWLSLMVWTWDSSCCTVDCRNSRNHLVRRSWLVGSATWVPALDTAVKPDPALLMGICYVSSF